MSVHPEQYASVVIHVTSLATGEEVTVTVPRAKGVTFDVRDVEVDASYSFPTPVKAFVVTGELMDDWELRRIPAQ